MEKKEVSVIEKKSIGSFEKPKNSKLSKKDFDAISFGNTGYSKSSIIEVPKIESSRQIETEKALTKSDILKKLSSGTPLRESLNDIVNGKMGALILVSNPSCYNIFKGGFYVNCKFTQKRLTELAKMDGAIILSNDFKKILYANTLLTPDSSLTSTETGTRHQAAERTAKQTHTLVIAVSERRSTITIYYRNSRYILQNTQELLRRTTETLQILEKQKEVFNELITNLNVLEVTNLVSVTDICTILERLEMIKKMSNIINEYIIELGREGVIVRMRMKEITKGIEEKEIIIIKDYLNRPIRAKQFFDSLSFEGLLDLENIAKVLFGKSLETSIIPKGYRILEKTNLSDSEIEIIMKNLKNIDNIFNSDIETLQKILKNSQEKAENLKKELSQIREHIMVGKKI